MNFDDSFKLLIDVEKGFSLNRNDEGNWTGGEVGEGELKGTKYGISAAAYPELDIKNLTVKQAKDIYHRDYWDKLKLEGIPEIIRFDLFDTAVNSGVSTAAKLLQRTVKVKEDGVIGLITLTAVAKEGFVPERLDKRFNAVRLLYIASLSERNWDNFGKGWVRRIANNMLND
jgi:Putative secretion activating protein